MTVLDHPVKQKCQCGVCESSSLEEVFFLPKFPFTGIYCTPTTQLHDFIYSGVDQGLSYCSSCGHAQLKCVVDPHLVYDHTYTHRGSQSPSARGGNEFFAAFVEKIFPHTEFKKIIDIGCNDGYLLSKLEHRANSLLGVDPIWIGQDHKLSEKISLVGGFVEDLDLQSQTEGTPNLIVSSHTFEHIENPREVLEKVLAKVKTGTKFVIEVPSFDMLVQNHRFDQVFHQHIQYFSVASLAQMVQSLGCSYISHTFNHLFFGGTLLFAFEKGVSQDLSTQFKKISREEISQSLDSFRHLLADVSVAMDSLPNQQIYGFGAAQILPVLAYHMPCHLAKIRTILDDDPRRQGFFYPNLPFKIASSTEIDFQTASVLVTALDSVRGILPRLIQLRTRHILVPMRKF